MNRINDVISRHAAVEAIENTDWYHLMDGVMVRGANSKEHQAWYKEQDIYKALEQLPSVQPDIIHCKDCKHWREGTAFSYCDKLHGMGVLDALDYMTAEDDYCSMAERRIDEQEEGEQE